MTEGGPYSSLDRQILAYIEAARVSDKEAKLEDFQLRIVANDLVLFNLKTGRTYLLADDDTEVASLALGSRPAKVHARTVGTIINKTAALAVPWALRLLGWVAARHSSSRGRRLTS
jgi:hypothetical protein